MMTPAITATPAPGSASRYALLLALLLLALLFTRGPDHNGDAVEYSLQTIALARHGTPDIGLDDIAVAKQLVPSRIPVYQIIEHDMRSGQPELYAAFTRGKDGKVYAVHFFGYALLTALPFKLLQALGADPFRAYQIVNLGMVYLLGLSLFRLFRSSARALLGLGLFMLSGGLQYWAWGSPECLSAAALLAALILYCDGMALAAGLLAGLAGLQNPTIAVFFVFAPLLQLCLTYRADTGLRDSLRQVLRGRALAGLAAGLALFLLAPLFNLWQFGVPNIIAKLFSDPGLINGTRLHSFYFDLNQGMLIGLPGVWAGLLLLGWRGLGPAGRWRQAALLGLCTLFSLALALPALAVLNWNSAATGVMRYAFWAGAAFLFPLLWRLRARPHWPRAALLAIVALQGGATWLAFDYNYVHLSPLSAWIMQRHPAALNPEPEIFAERNTHVDDRLLPERVYALSVDGPSNKLLYHRSNAALGALLCGEGNSLAEDNRIVDSMRQWRYLNGPVRCHNASASASRTLALAQFRQLQSQLLVYGWATPEGNGSDWDGVWSDGASSRLQVTIDRQHPPATLTISGYYFAGNAHTHVFINDVDLGMRNLQEAQPMPVPAAVREQGQLQVLLLHQAPGEPGPNDTRHLALFLRKIELR